MDFHSLAYFGNAVERDIAVIQSKSRSRRNLSPPGVFGITHLGHPVYFLKILGIWKILGVVAVLIPKFPLLKEWAYAGFFFVVTGAAYSHIAVGDSMKELFPAVLLMIMTVLSWYFRPTGRKIISAKQYSHGQEFGLPKNTTEMPGTVGAVGA